MMQMLKMGMAGELPAVNDDPKMSILEMGMAYVSPAILDFLNNDPMMRMMTMDMAEKSHAVNNDPMMQLIKLGIASGMADGSPNIPVFHLEYKKKYPNEEKHFQELASLFEEARAEHMRMPEFTIKECRYKSIMDISYIRKRFGFPLNEGLRRKIYCMKPGDIIVEADTIKFEKLAYPKALQFHSFTNCSQKKIVLNYGKNYVSIGFVDLSFLKNNQLKSYEDEQDPINIYLYDSCPFVCAKSKIILLMLQDKSITVESIVQVWYSSGWSYQTDKDFVQACNYYLSKFEEEDQDIKTIIRGWSEAPQVPIQKSRDKWLDSVLPLTVDCYNLLYENDRVDMSRYFVTGELLACDVGSRCMFVIPLKGYQRRRDESFLYSQDLRTISDNKTSFLSSVVDQVLKEIQITKNTFEENKRLLNVHIIRNDISPAYQDTLAEIKNLDPLAIVWSNLCDYYPKDDFMYMVGYVSAKHTMHVGHSMNWAQMVFGTEISDYSIPVTTNLIESINKIDIKGFYSGVGGIVVRLNPKYYTNLRNKGEWILGQAHKGNWAKYYLGETKHDIVDTAFPFGYEHQNNTLFFQFTLK
jgi:hypothetical protein